MQLTPYKLKLFLTYVRNRNSHAQVLETNFQD